MQKSQFCQKSTRCTFCCIGSHSHFVQILRAGEKAQHLKNDAFCKIEGEKSTTIVKLGRFCSKQLKLKIKTDLVGWTYRHYPSSYPMTSSPIVTHHGKRVYPIFNTHTGYVLPDLPTYPIGYTNQTFLFTEVTSHNYTNALQSICCGALFK